MQYYKSYNGLSVHFKIAIFTVQAVAKVLSQLSPEEQSNFIAAHRSLRASAAAIGEALPEISLGGVTKAVTEAQEESAELVAADISNVREVQAPLLSIPSCWLQ